MCARPGRRSATRPTLCGVADRQLPAPRRPSPDAGAELQALYRLSKDSDSCSDHPIKDLDRERPGSPKRAERRTAPGQTWHRARGLQLRRRAVTATGRHGADVPLLSYLFERALDAHPKSQELLVHARTRICTCTRTCKQTRTHAHTHAHARTRTHARTHANACTHISFIDFQ